MWGKVFSIFIYCSFWLSSHMKQMPVIILLGTYANAVIFIIISRFSLKEVKNSDFLFYLLFPIKQVVRWILSGALNILSKF